MKFLERFLFALSVAGFLLFPSPVLSKEKVKTAEQTEKKNSKKKKEDLRMKLMVLNFTASNFPEDIALSLSDSARNIFREMKIYSVSQLQRDNLDEKIKRKIPENCTELRCLLKMGQLLKLSKVVGGELSYDGTYYAVQIKIADILTGRSGGKIWLASECNVDEIHYLLRAALYYLHGQAPKNLPILVKNYHGPDFSRHTMWAATAGLTALAGIGYAVYDGAINGEDNNSNDSIISNYSKMGSDELSGIPSAFGFSDMLYLGARPNAMGNAYTAVSDDAVGLLWNPAGIARIHHSEITVGYLNHIAQIPLGGLSYVGKFSRTGSYGAAVRYNGDAVLHETEVVSGFAKLYDELFPGMRPVSFGINAKMRMSSWGEEGVGIDRSTGNSFGFAFDAGIQAELADYIQFGLVARDVYSTQTYKNTATDTSYNEGTPAILVIGGAFYASPSLLLTTDGQIPLYIDQDYKLGMGIEKVLFGVLALRGGISQNLDFHEQRIGTCGAGIIIKSMEISSSYEFYNQEKPFRGSWQAFTTIKF